MGALSLSPPRTPPRTTAKWVIHCRHDRRDPDRDRLDWTVYSVYLYHPLSSIVIHHRRYLGPGDLLDRAYPSRRGVLLVEGGADPPRSHAPEGGYDVWSEGC